MSDKTWMAPVGPMQLPFGMRVFDEGWVLVGGVRVLPSFVGGIAVSEGGHAILVTAGGPMQTKATPDEAYKALRALTREERDAVWKAEREADEADRKAKQEKWEAWRSAIAFAVLANGGMIGPEKIDEINKAHGYERTPRALCPSSGQDKDPMVFDYDEKGREIIATYEYLRVRREAQFEEQRKNDPEWIKIRGVWERVAAKKRKAAKKKTTKKKITKPRKRGKR